MLRVINEAVENSLNSFLVNCNTFLNTLSLKILPSVAATLDDNSIIITAATMLTNAIPII